MTEATRDDESQMTLVEHLTELRRRLIISIIAIVFGAAVAFAFYNQILAFLSHPYQETTGHDLIATDPLQPLLVRVKVASYGGFVLAFPIVIWEVWRFITPGLHKHEKRYAIPFVVASVLLFALGGFIAWLTFPRALDFLIGWGGQDVEAAFTVDKYLGLISLMIVAFGLSFEFPIILMFLLLARVVNTRQLRNYRRWAIIGIVTFAAVITPSQDPYSLFFMAVPMYLFYEAAIVIGRLLKR